MRLSRTVRTALAAVGIWTLALAAPTVLVPTAAAAAPGSYLTVASVPSGSSSLAAVLPSASGELAAPSGLRMEVLPDEPSQSAESAPPELIEPTPTAAVESPSYLPNTGIHALYEKALTAALLLLVGAALLVVTRRRTQR